MSITASVSELMFTKPFLYSITALPTISLASLLATSSLAGLVPHPHPRASYDQRSPVTSHTKVPALGDADRHA